MKFYATTMGETFWPNQKNIFVTDDEKIPIFLKLFNLIRQENKQKLIDYSCVLSNDFVTTINCAAITETNVYCDSDSAKKLNTLAKTQILNPKIKFISSIKIKEILESKVNLADAFKFFMGSASREYVKQYLLRKKKFIDHDEMHIFMQNLLVKSDVIYASNKHDLIQNIKLQMLKFKTSGIVFQTNTGCSGQGTAIFSSNEIEVMLIKTDEEILTTLINKFNNPLLNTLQMQDLMLNDGLSLQEKINIEQEFVMINHITNGEVIPYTCTIQHTDAMGHIGNDLISIDIFEQRVLGSNLDIDRLNLAHEIIFDKILTKASNNNVNMDDVLQENLEYRCITFGVDFFLTKDTKGNLRIKISEYNPRLLSSDSFLDGAEHENLQVPFRALIANAYITDKDAQKISQQELSTQFVCNLDKQINLICIPHNAIISAFKIKRIKNNYKIQADILFPEFKLNSCIDKELKVKKEIEDVLCNLGDLTL